MKFIFEQPGYPLQKFPHLATA